ncbi:MAG: hypothetical protein SAJ12_03910 [Jaaginema sp. PMC 1079.18]|nr:hypothetical protein [Jaaginema sp. PMC 1080.18]MEC4850133.1 hypothetical protein [Jaaginema sp. PMC 1079.18]MEC4866340.1 hypothetical protein [Jaaginema sp. PMC 1078.18]
MLNQWYGYGSAIATAALVVTVAATPASADTYRAGEFTITLSANDTEGQVYYGCDARGNCIRLKYGTGWRDSGRRGITWENGNYTYVVSWSENSTSASMYLNVFEGDRRLLRKPMYLID